jgi:hypothetical protein
VVPADGGGRRPVTLGQLAASIAEA